MDNDIKGSGDPGLGPESRAIDLLLGLKDAIEHSDPAAGITEDHKAQMRQAIALMREAENRSVAYRYAVVALRDLVWRADTARYFLVQRPTQKELRQVANMLSTTDTHNILREFAANTE